MEYELSLDGYIEKIYSPKTKEYFWEVHSSYVNNNLRSAIVMLWTVVVCDILSKLEALRDLYHDSKAEKILVTIQSMQQANPTSPAWEDKLLDEINEKTNLFELSEYQNLKHLHEQRHLCAHPIIEKDEELYSPSRSEVKTHILNAIDGLLSKPPILTNKVFDKFTEDIEENSGILINDSDLERFLYHRFLKSLPINTLDDFFKKLWSFIFFKDEERYNKNRKINYRVLAIIYKKDISHYQKVIQDDKSYYSNLIVKDTAKPLEVILSSEDSEIDERTLFLLEFLSTFPTVYKLLTIDAQTLIGSFCEKYTNLYALAWYLNDSIKEHANYVLAKIKKNIFIQTDTYTKMASVLIDNNCKSILYDIGIFLYVNSRSFNTADIRFAAMIKPYIDDFGKSQLYDLLDGIIINNQTYGRSRANSDHLIVRETIIKKFGDYDHDKYLMFDYGLPQITKKLGESNEIPI
jgi:hypothetical protein